MTSDDNLFIVEATLILVFFSLVIIAIAVLNEPYNKTISANSYGGCNSPFGGVIVDRETGCIYHVNDCDLYNYIYNKEINVTIRKDIFTNVRTIIDAPGYVKPKQTQKECNC